VAPLGIELPIRAQRAQILIVDPGGPLGTVPVFSDLVSLQYVRPEGPSLLVGDSDHSQPEWTDPDVYRERASDVELSAMIPKLEHRFPGFAATARLSSSYAGCYDVTPDYNPIISSTQIEGLWVCAGFSGHGYKISPAVGELMADLLTTGRSRSPDIDPRDFRLGRFADADHLVSPHPYVGAGQMR
jgi:sarcosine oxidase, subunit beta